MYDPSDISNMIALLQAQPQPQAEPKVQLAGDVIGNIGSLSNPNTGPTNKSADYAWGNKIDPKVTGIGKENMMNWLSRAASRYRGGYVPALPPPPVGSKSGGTNIMPLPPYM